MATAAFTGIAILVLGRALWVVDPSLTYVARHSSTQTPLPYRIAGIWGGMEGSLLFWAFVVACTFAGAVVTGRERPRRELAALAGVGGTTTAVFLAVSLIRASPFETLEIPTGSGDGLLAVLQHPAMIYHPPILYLGLALTGVPAALTMSALVRRRLDRRWRSSVLRWLRAGWLVLALGIVTGSQWAYAELGWGGLWAWDPVENSSLLPWLAATVALHLLVQPDRFSLGAASAVVGGFCLMVCGVYVTRSGSTGSIHAFSDSPEVGRPLLVFAAACSAVGVWALARNRVTARRDDPIRPSVFGVHAALGAVAVMAIALGTFWPVVDGLLLSDVGTRSLVRPDYYHRALAPVAVVSLLAMAVGPLVSGGRRLEPRVRRNVAIAMTVGAAGALVVAGLAVGSSRWITPARIGVIASAGAAIGGSVVHTVEGRRRSGRGTHRARRTLGVAVAHCGFAIVLLGAVASSGGGDDTVRVDVGATVELVSAVGNAGTELTLVDLEPGRADRYELVRGLVEIADGGGDPVRYSPELRAYEQQRIPTAEAVIDGALSGDTIVVLESVGADLGSATFTVRTRPLLPWVWVGAALVILGGLATLGGRSEANSGEVDATPDRSAAAARR